MTILVTAVLVTIGASFGRAESRQSVGVPQRASELMGMEVRNLADEKLGKVEDLIVNIGAGRTTYVIMASGGIFGLGDQLIVVPAHRFDYRPHDKKLVLNAEKEFLKGAPAYDKAKLPDWNDEAWNLKVESYYDRQAASTNAVPGHGETGKATGPVPREPAKSGRTDEIAGQGSSEKDVLITRTIRKELMQSSLSTGAKNIQVITRNGHVTLMGKVRSAAEREQTVATAKRVAGLQNVTDRLETAD